MNRGNNDINSLVHVARQENFSDLVILHETRGRPDGLIISHLPYGPTAYFTLYNVMLRRDIERESIKFYNIVDFRLFRSDFLFVFWSNKVNFRGVKMIGRF